MLTHGPTGAFKIPSKLNVFFQKPKWALGKVHEHICYILKQEEE